MAKPLPYLMEDPKKFYKNNKEYYNLSFFAFIFSVFVYISVFYIFNLSPSNLFNNAMFWFLISNTLVFIIAADYGAFSSSNDNKRDVYDEYLVHTEAAKRRSSSLSFESEHSDVAKKTNVVVDQSRKEDHSLMQEKKEERVIADQETEIPEKKLQIVAKNDQELNKNLGSTTQEEDIQEKTIVVCEENRTSKQQAKTYKRSKSEKDERVVMDESYNKNSDRLLMRRSETNVVDQENYNHHVEDDINEFSTMSDEDLSRRIEEFIQSFNRQIRLQARTYNNN
ncbi:cotton fiber protein [Parasponia andersonii]|uniref:Cotton fiber protein n=1 Tax=Parasponia andersonii TaxID=3476 RepID=A0A2P5DH87_PARAD|nr:cotton fiber protein [Parasponia andersonii]